VGSCIGAAWGAVQMKAVACASAPVAVPPTAANRAAQLSDSAGSFFPPPADSGSRAMFSSGAGLHLHLDESSCGPWSCARIERAAGCRAPSWCGVAHDAGAAWGPHWQSFFRWAAGEPPIEPLRLRSALGGQPDWPVMANMGDWARVEWLAWRAFGGHGAGTSRGSAARRQGREWSPMRSRPAGP